MSAEAMLLYYNDRTVLDRETHWYYKRVTQGYVERNEVYGGHIYNQVADAWCDSLRLSHLLEDEPPPPEGHVGQYGILGCVLVERSYGMTDCASDVVLFPYEEKDLDRFMREIREKTGTRFWRSTSLDPYIFDGGLHPLTPLDPWTSAQEGQRYVMSSEGYEIDIQTDVYAALVWGRTHAERLRQAVSPLE